MGSSSEPVRAIGASVDRGQCGLRPSRRPPDSPRRRPGACFVTHNHAARLYAREYRRESRRTPGNTGTKSRLPARSINRHPHFSGRSIGEQRGERSASAALHSKLSGCRRMGPPGTPPAVVFPPPDERPAAGAESALRDGRRSGTEESTRRNTRGPDRDLGLIAGTARRPPRCVAAGAVYSPHARPQSGSSEVPTSRMRSGRVRSGISAMRTPKISSRDSP